MQNDRLGTDINQIRSDTFTAAAFIYLMETFKAALATSEALPVLSDEFVFLCCTIRMPPALTKNWKRISNYSGVTRVFTCKSKHAKIVFHDSTATWITHAPRSLANRTKKPIY